MESEVEVINACVKGNFNEINDYLQYGGSLELKDRNGNTCLIAAAASDRVETVFYLLEKGAEVNATNKIGNTALSYAVTRDNHSIAQILLARGADVNMANNAGKRVIDIATSSRMTTIIQGYVEKEKLEKLALSSPVVAKSRPSVSSSSENKKRGSFSNMFGKNKDKEKATTSSSTSVPGSIASISIIEFLKFILPKFSPLVQQLPNSPTTSSQWDSLLDILPSSPSYLSRIAMDSKQAQKEYMYVKTHHPLLFNYYQSFCSTLFTTMLACHTVLKFVIYTQDRAHNFQATLNTLAGFCSELGHLNASFLPGRYVLRGIIQFLLSITTDAHRKVVIDRLLQVFVYSSLENIVELLARKMTIISQADIVHWNSAAAPKKLQEIVWLPALESHEMGLSVLSYLHVGTLLDHVMKVSSEEFITSNLDQSSKFVPLLISWASGLPVEWSPMAEGTLIVAVPPSKPTTISPTHYSSSELNTLLADDSAFTEYCDRLATQTEPPTRKIRRSSDIPSIPQRAHDILKQYQSGLPPELDPEEHKDSRSSLTSAVPENNKLRQSIHQEKNVATKTPSKGPPPSVPVVEPSSAAKAKSGKSDKKSGRCIVS